MKIIIITGPIYPHSSPRSFRSTELAIELANQGHDVILYSILGEYDYSEFERKYNLKVKSLGKSYFGNQNSDGICTSRTIMNRAISKFFYNIIDYPRIEYFFKTIRALKKEQEFDYLITIAHPFGIHWGASYFKKYINSNLFKVWASDCGDPFMGDTDVPRWNLLLKPIEKFWCKQTDYIVVPIKEAINGYYEEFWNKIEVIPQGINFNSIETVNYEKNPIPTFLYAGAVYPGMRDPSEFLEYLVTLNTDFRFIVYSDSDIFKRYKDLLRSKLEIRDFIERKVLIKISSSMDFLINLKNNSDVQQPSKLIDYGLTKRPIIDISTPLSENERDTFEEFLQANYINQVAIENFNQFDIKNVAEKFIKLYESK